MRTRKITSVSPFFGAAAALLLASRLSGAGLLITGGDKIQGSNQGNAQFVAAGVFFEKPLSRAFDARLEIFPAQLFRERARPEREGPSHRVTVTASAACLLARYHWRDGARTSLFAEAGAGPFYAYSQPVPSGGTRGNFFDQVGVGARRGRWAYFLRFTHVSNANIGPQRHRGNPGLSFAAAGISWAFR
ncbi:MAG: acyloxyacyl hydrolase [Thermoanaerobaculia bacterium]